MPYFAKKELATGHYLERGLYLEKPVDGQGFEWEQITNPTDVEIWVEPKVTFNLDTLDSWLASEPAIQPYRDFFPIISRASAKNSVPGYQLMVAVAASEDYNIPAEIILLVTNKLEELGANII